MSTGETIFYRSSERSIHMPIVQSIRKLVELTIHKYKRQIIYDEAECIDASLDGL